MNCHQARQYISPYLDHQLTGREMLALQDHAAVCTACEREMESIRQLKALLRGLREPRLQGDFSQAVALRIEQRETLPHGLGILWMPAARPQRGRRLATALALSCLTVLSFVAPFAPDGRNAAQTSSSMLGAGSQAFVFPSPTDVILSGRVPERVIWLPASDLAHLPPADPAAPMRGNALLMTSLELPPMPTIQSSQETSRTQDEAFGSVQFAAFRPR